MYHVNYIRPAGLKIGVLPRYDPGLVWDKTPGRGSGVFTEVDLRLAEQYGYQLEFTGNCLLWDAVGHPFGSFVNTLYALKAAEQDVVVRGIWKHMLVCLYGKMAQSEQGYAKKKRAEISEDEAGRRELEGLEYEYEGEGAAVKYYMKDSKSGHKKNNKPNHLGCYILSWSRKMMLRLYELVGFEFEYSHTDSIRVTYAMYHKLRKEGYVDGGLLGMLDPEYGVIYERIQQHVNKYTLKVLKPDGSLGVIEKGC
jgi:hypothetical protein